MKKILILCAIALLLVTACARTGDGAETATAMAFLFDCELGSGDMGEDFLTTISLTGLSRDSLLGSEIDIDISGPEPQTVTPTFYKNNDLWRADATVPIRIEGRYSFDATVGGLSVSDYFDVNDKNCGGDAAVESGTSDVAIDTGYTDVSDTSGVYDLDLVDWELFASSGVAHGTDSSLDFSGDYYSVGKLRLNVRYQDEPVQDAEIYVGAEGYGVLNGQYTTMGTTNSQGIVDFDAPLISHGDLKWEIQDVIANGVRLEAQYSDILFEVTEENVGLANANEIASAENQVSFVAEQKAKATCPAGTVPIGSGEPEGPICNNFCPGGTCTNNNGCLTCTKGGCDSSKGEFSNLADCNQACTGPGQACESQSGSCAAICTGPAQESYS
jgi:hypothetical protein